jgi:hypothetical protein
MVARINPAAIFPFGIKSGGCDLSFYVARPAQLEG